MNHETMRVSICCITYNHAPYIRAALDSMLMQETSFDFEIVIGEDASTDDTRAIIEDYCRLYPSKIRLLPAAGNLGMMRNFKNTLLACKGDFIAFCEGDDYWTDPHKLAKQVAFLEQHPDYCLACHNCDNLLSNGTLERNRFLATTDQSFDIATLALKPVVASMSVMIRNGQDLYFPDWLLESSIGDLPFFLMYARRGKIFYDATVMCIYRVHQNGTWSSRSEQQLLEGLTFVCRQLMQEDLPEKVMANLHARLNERLELALKDMLFNHEWEETRKLIDRYPFLSERYAKAGAARLKLIFTIHHLRRHSLRQSSSFLMKNLIRDIRKMGKRSARHHPPPGNPPTTY